MSHLNILTISKEIDNINKNIHHFSTQIQKLDTDTQTINSNVQDVNEIKMDKIDAVNSLHQIREDFKFLETKLNSVDKCVKKLLDRNMDFVNKNTEIFFKFLKNNVGLSDQKINIILAVFDCKTPQDYLLLNERELIDFGFTQSELSLLSRSCKDCLENNIYPSNVVEDEAISNLNLNNVVGV